MEEGHDSDPVLGLEEEEEEESIVTSSIFLFCCVFYFFEIDVDTTTSAVGRFLHTHMDGPWRTYLHGISAYENVGKSLEELEGFRWKNRYGSFQEFDFGPRSTRRQNFVSEIGTNATLTLVGFLRTWMGDCARAWSCK